MKRCPSCGETKDSSAFSRNKSKRDGLSGYCKPCTKAKERAHYQIHNERIRARTNSYYHANKDKYRDWRRRNRRLKAYGIEHEELLQRLARQHHSCAICDVPISEETCYVDHDHELGPARGLLCQFCNMGLGCFKDNETLMRKAACYVVRWRKCNA